MTEHKIDRRKFLQTAVVSATALGTSTAALAASDKNSRKRAGVPHKPLGSTGVDIPIIQLGTSQRLDPVYDKLMHRCFKSGVTAIDTALSYGWGSSHQAINNFIQQIGERSQLWITSKSGSGSTGGLKKGLDQALGELGTDYLDLYLMHGINRVSMLDAEYLRLGDALRKSGKTRFFGFSCHSGNVVELMNKAAQAGAGAIDVILFRYNFRRYGDRELNLAIDSCYKAGIGLMAMKTMGSVPKGIEAVVDFRSQNFTLGQAKLKSVWADERIATIVSEMDSVKLVRENIEAARSEIPLSAEESHQLNQLAAFSSPYACNGCSHLCEAAIGGKTAIADQLRYLMYFESYGKPARARELYQNLAPEARRFDERELKAAAAACPQRIDIAARLKQARSVLAG